MYKNLKFSWAHILLFLAVIIYGYVTYVGLTYQLDEGLIKPLVVTLIFVAILLLWFVGVQQTKGLSNNFKFRKWIWVERFLFFTAPIIFVLCMAPFNHAWNVANHSDEIESQFKESILSSKTMFDDYELYANERIDNYRKKLERVRNNRNIQPSVYSEMGFTGKNDKNKIDLEIKTLTNQLKGNFENLRNDAVSWLDKADTRTSVWNVFLVGNIKEIKSAIINWSNKLKDFSSVILTTEGGGSNSQVEPFNANNYYLDKELENLNSLSAIYTAPDSLTFMTIILGCILFIMMILPYFIQKRNGVNTYTLLGRRYVNDGGITMTTQDIQEENSTEIPPIVLDNMSKNNDTLINGYSEEDDEEEAKRIRRERRRKRRQKGYTSEIIEDNEGYGIKEDENDDDIIITPIDL